MGHFRVSTRRRRAVRHATCNYAERGDLFCERPSALGIFNKTGPRYIVCTHCIQAVKLQSKKIAIFHGALNEKQCEIHQLQSIVFLFTYVPIREFDKINYVTLYGLLHWI